MNLRVVAALTGLLGGGCWLARLAVEESALTWAGLGLVLFAVAVVGLGLVSPRSPAVLRVVVALGCAALAWSMLEVVRHAGRDHVVDAAVGALGVLAALAALATAPRGSRGGHSRGGRARPRGGARA